MKVKTLIIGLAGLLLFISCKKSFIDLTPQTRVTEANFFHTAADYQQATVAAYSPLRSLFNDAYVMGEMRSDNATYFSSPGLSGGQFIDKYNISGFLDAPVNGDNSNKYVNCYNGIAKTNAILVRIDNANIDAATKANVKGQAQFLRAFYYFELVQYYGGVPLHLTEVTTVAQAALPRSSASDVYNQIVADATSAMNLLPIKQNTLGMVTKGSAETLLGYVYMTLKQYSNAEKVLTDVTTFGYSLLPNYASIFNPANKNNAESIFEVQYLAGSQGLASNFAFQFAPNISDVKNILGVTGNNQTIGGWNKPTPDLIAAYEPGDTRKAASIGSSYVDGSGNTVIDNYVIKYSHPPYTLFNNTGDDWIVYRYADVLLLLAECLNEEGKSTQSIPYLNQVRARAGLARATVTSQTDLRTAIAHERRVELAFENHRWLDLVRTGQAVSVMTTFGVTIKQQETYLPVNAYTNINQNRFIFPLPQNEIDINKLLTQNPGY
jgi:hypothetical protein